MKMSNRTSTWVSLVKLNNKGLGGFVAANIRGFANKYTGPRIGFSQILQQNLGGCSHPWFNHCSKILTKIPEIRDYLNPHDSPGEKPVTVSSSSSEGDWTLCRSSWKVCHEGPPRDSTVGSSFCFLWVKQNYTTHLGMVYNGLYQLVYSSLLYHHK